MLLNNAESADLLKTRAMLVPKTVNTLHHCLLFTKGGFLSESAIRFSNLQISKIKIFQNTILSLKFELVVYCYRWEIFGDLKNTSHYLKKKPPLLTCIIFCTKNTENAKYFLGIKLFGMQLCFHQLILTSVIIKNCLA